MRTIFSITLKEVDDGYLFEAKAVGIEPMRRHYPIADKIDLEKFLKRVVDAGGVAIADPKDDDDARAIGAQALFEERCARAKRIIARAHDELGDDLGGSVTDLLADNMVNLSLLEIRGVMDYIGWTISGESDDGDSNHSLE